MDLQKNDIRKIFNNFLIPAISGAIAVSSYRIRFCDADFHAAGLYSSEKNILKTGEAL